MAAGIGLLVLAGTIGTTLGWRRAMAEQRIAERRLQVISEFPDSLVEFSQRIAHSANMTDARKQLLALWDKSNARLKAEAGEDSTLRLLLARSYLTVAGVQAGVSTNNVGDVPGANASLAEAMRILDDLARVNPNDPAVLEQQAMVWMRRGELAQLRDDVPARLAAYQEARSRLEAAVVIAPEDISTRRRLATAVLEIGDALKEQGQVTQAEAAYRESVRLREELLKRGAGDGSLTRDATVGWTRLASMLHAEGADNSDETTLREALVLYRKVESARRSLLERSPDSTQTRRDLMYAHQYVGALHAQLGEYDESTAALASAVSLATDLVIADPGNSRFAEDYSRILDAALQTSLSIMQQGADGAAATEPMARQAAVSARRLRVAATEQAESSALVDAQRKAQAAADELQAAIPQ